MPVALITILIIIFGLTGCTKEPYHGKSLGTKRSTTTTTKTNLPGYSIERETMKPDQQNLAMIRSPKRDASLQVAELGRQQLAENKFEQAMKTFEEAITIDPSNGAAYYYLSRTHLLVGDTDKASGILDKAEELLAGDNNWLALCADLRNAIERNR